MLCYSVDRQKSSDVKKNISPHKINNNVKNSTTLFCSRRTRHGSLVYALHELNVSSARSTESEIQCEQKSEKLLLVEVEALTVDFEKKIHIKCGCHRMRCACTFSFDVELMTMMSSICMRVYYTYK